MDKELLKQYFVFTKKEKRGTFLILTVILLVFVSGKYIYPLLLREDTISSKEIAAIGDSIKVKAGEGKNFANDYSEETNYHVASNLPEHNAFTGELFNFDPNTLDLAGWKKLGIRDKTAQTILHYVSKGGKFREPEDINKIWGLRDAEKQRLIPYVRIANEKRAGSYKDYPRYEKKVYEKRAPQFIDINSADSVSFVSLPGIGPGFTKRILRFRDKLGGFYKTDQVAETFGLPDSVFQKIKPLLKISSADVRKININTASNEELKAHPYIRWQLANVITEYKKQHGDFKELSELKKIMLIDDILYQKILPYLTI